MQEKQASGEIFKAEQLTNLVKFIQDHYPNLVEDVDNDKAMIKIEMFNRTIYDLINQ